MLQWNALPRHAIKRQSHSRKHILLSMIHGCKRPFYCISALVLQSWLLFAFIALVLPYARLTKLTAEYLKTSTKRYNNIFNVAVLKDVYNVSSTLEPLRAHR